jgi:hypothetical protein
MGAVRTTYVLLLPSMAQDAKLTSNPLKTFLYAYQASSFVIFEA